MVVGIGRGSLGYWTGKLGSFVDDDVGDPQFGSLGWGTRRHLPMPPSKTQTASQSNEKVGVGVVKGLFLERS